MPWVSITVAVYLDASILTSISDRIVDRPLWQTQEGLAEQFSISDEISITADDVAAALVEPIAGVNHKGERC
jgi:hypothetical protein